MTTEKADEQKVKEGQEIILGEISKTLDLLEKHFQKYCDEVAPHYLGQKATSVPIVYIKESFKQVKENMRKGAGL